MISKEGLRMEAQTESVKAELDFKWQVSDVVKHLRNKLYMAARENHKKVAVMIFSSFAPTHWLEYAKTEVKHACGDELQVYFTEKDEHGQCELVVDWS